VCRWISAGSDYCVSNIVNKHELELPTERIGYENGSSIGNALHPPQKPQHRVIRAADLRRAECRERKVCIATQPLFAVTLAIGVGRIWAVRERHCVEVDVGFDRCIRARETDAIVNRR
jgi:hypothetical protein